MSLQSCSSLPSRGQAEVSGVATQGSLPAAAWEATENLVLPTSVLPLPGWVSALHSLGNFLLSFPSFSLKPKLLSGTCHLLLSLEKYIYLAAHQLITLGKQPLQAGPCWDLVAPTLLSSARTLPRLTHFPELFKFSPYQAPLYLLNLPASFSSCLFISFIIINIII